ncbi:MAG: hypothetical protein GY792_30660, partial [Gammaproteobacteria bacterium]|nr:hypothetical protein [Gammaproteobacteria bacterium]
MQLRLYAYFWIAVLGSVSGDCVAGSLSVSMNMDEKLEDSVKSGPLMQVWRYLLREMEDGFLTESSFLNPDGNHDEYRLTTPMLIQTPKGPKLKMHYKHPPNSWDWVAGVCKGGKSTTSKSDAGKISRCLLYDLLSNSYLHVPRSGKPSKTSRGAFPELEVFRCSYNQWNDDFRMEV